MAGRFALVGGDEFTSGCESMDKAILESTGSASPMVLILPTAATLENAARAADNGIQHFASLGAKVSPLMVLDRAGAMDAGLAAQVDSADIVYMTGGSPGYLLETLRGSMLLRRIMVKLERGGLLAGSSAGAMVMGSWMRSQQWRRALGIVDSVAVLPHHERAGPNATLEQLRSAPAGLSTVFGIDGGSGAMSGPDGWAALGAGRVTVYRNGAWNRFERGQTFS